MSATINLTLEQLAGAISQLTPEELESLEILLDPTLTKVMLERSGEYERLKQTGQLLTLDELREDLKEDG